MMDLKNIEEVMILLGMGFSEVEDWSLSVDDDIEEIANDMRHLVYAVQHLQQIIDDLIITNDLKLSKRHESVKDRIAREDAERTGN